MTSVLAYLLAVLLVPVCFALVLFVMARFEEEPPSVRPPHLPHAP